MNDGLLLLAVALLACALGVVAGMWIAGLRSAAATTDARRAGESALATSQERVAASDRRATELESRLHAAELARDEARVAVADARSRIAQLEGTLESERRATSEKLAVLDDAQRRMTEAFKALSTDALRANNTDFLNLARETFDSLQKQSAGDLTKRQEAIQLLIGPLKESLEKVDRHVSEIENARAQQHGRLGEQLEQLNSAQLRLQTEAGRLSSALRSTAYTGSWGEMQLRRVVEMADMLPHVDFAEQQTVGSLRADMVIHLPGGQQIVVDSKSPIQSYREAVDAPDEATRAERLKDHAQKVRSYVDALGAKSYFEQFQPSPEFVVLFMPGDHFLAAALQADPTLLDRAIARRVLLATPTTFIALLKSAAFGWSHQAATQNVAEIKLAGQQLHERLAVFAEHLESAGRNLDAAVRGYNSAVGSFEQNLLPGARRLAEIGARSARQVPELPGLEVSPREITKRS